MYIPYVSGNQILGHYAVAQRSGELAATIGALGHLARIRWTDTAASCVLNRISVGLTVSAAVTTAVEMNLRAIIVRQFTVDFTTAMTAISMVGVGNTNKMRSWMGSSRMGTAGPGISTTAVLSGQTLTADAAPFAMATFTNPSTTLGVTAVTNQVGAGVPMTVLYERTAEGQHPVVLSANEGVVIQPVTAGPASGTFALYVQWEWSECLTF